MRKLLIIIAATLLMSVQAATTYIPTYSSFIQITRLGTDSVMAENNFEELELMAQDSSFSITLVHENVDKDKVKAIKRAKAAAGWMTFAAVMSGFSAGFNSGYTNNALMTYIDMRRTENIAALSGVMHVKAKNEEYLNIEFFIDNLTERELMVADLARGLTWYILPHTSMQFSMENPGIERLRISYLDHTSVKYADIIGGNYVKKEDIEWEDDDCWIIRRNAENPTGEYRKDFDYIYFYMEKATYESWEMTEKEVKEFKKAHKVQE